MFGQFQFKQISVGLTFISTTNFCNFRILTDDVERSDTVLLSDLVRRYVCGDGQVHQEPERDLQDSGGLDHHQGSAAGRSGQTVSRLLPLETEEQSAKSNRGWIRRILGSG